MNNGTDINNLFAEAAEKLRREAYAAGWRDALAALTKAASEVPELPVLDGGTPTDFGNSSAATSGVTQGSTPWYVLQAVKKKPGMTGSEVVSVVQGGGHNVSEGSIRTTLVRLKAKRLIASRHGKWFAA